MSLDVTLTATREVGVFNTNITHNLIPMAHASGLYVCCWCPEELGIKTAGQLIEPLTEGLKRLKANPELFQQYNPENGWGSYGRFVLWVERYLEACKENPDAKVKVWT